MNGWLSKIPSVHMYVLKGFILVVSTVCICILTSLIGLTVSSFLLQVRTCHGDVISQPIANKYVTQIDESQA